LLDYLKIIEFENNFYKVYDIYPRVGNKTISDGLSVLINTVQYVPLFVQTPICWGPSSEKYMLPVTQSTAMLVTLDKPLYKKDDIHKKFTRYDKNYNI